LKLGAISIVLFVGCSAATPVVTIEVEPDSLAIRGGELVESIGIETLGGVFTPLLEVGCRIPCEATNTFSTTADNQTEISVSLFRGTEELAIQNHSLGEFVVTEIPAATRGEPQVAITVRADSGAILLSAHELSGAIVQLQRRGR
jgi:molecular chaperone DnaK